MMRRDNKEIHKVENRHMHDVLWDSELMCTKTSHALTF